jgi:hypothetical protein
MGRRAQWSNPATSPETGLKDYDGQCGGLMTENTAALPLPYFR